MSHKREGGQVIRKRSRWVCHTKKKGGRSYRRGVGGCVTEKRSEG